MYRFFSTSKKLSNNYYASSLLHSQHQKTFTALTNPIHHSYNHKYRIFSLFPLNPTYHFYSCQSHHKFSRKIHVFLSNPLLSKQFISNLSNTHFKGSCKRVMDYKVRSFVAWFVRGYSGFNRPNFVSYGRSWRSWFHRLSADNMVLGLILANVAVFMLWRIADKKFMMENFMISLDNFKSGRVHTLVTSAFSHIDIEHIVSNMVGLYFFGTNIGRTFGPEYLLKLYLAGAIGGSLFYLVHHALMALSTKGQGMWVKDPSRTPGLGASGAVNAIMLLDIFLNPRATLYFDFIIPVPAILLGIFLIGKDVLRMIEGNSNISGSAHLGGATIAAIAYARIRKGRI